MKWQQWVKSLQFKILIGFFILFGLICLWALIHTGIDNRRYAINQLLQESRTIQSLQHSKHQNIQLFQLSGFKDPSLYNQGTQVYLEDYKSQNRLVLERLERLDFRAENLNISLLKLPALEEQITQISDSVNQLVELYRRRGFKDYGLEGTMRTIAHTIEADQSIKPEEYLMLRRHEKDFINRLEWVYVKRFNDYYLELRKKCLKANKSIGLLECYRNEFNNLANLQKRIGLNENSGLIGNINLLSAQVDDEFESSFSSLQNELSSLSTNLDRIFKLAGLFMALILLALSFNLSRRISRDIKQFTLGLRSYSRSNFQNSESFAYLRTGTFEVQVLVEEFMKMSRQLQVSIKEMEDAVQTAKHSAAVKSFFLANMSHEIRTPLNGVLGMIELLKETEDPKIQAEYFQTIDFSAQHLGDLVNMILDFSKIEAGKLELHPQPTDLEKTLENLIKMFQIKAQENHNHLLLNSRLQLGHELIFDNLRLQQVLINLLNNALKFTKEGTVKLSAEMLEMEQPDHVMLRFSVKDTGIGIQTDKINKLLDAYFQAESGVQKEFGGTGLGLFICDELVKLMGGQLCIESTYGQGSEFYFQLEFPLGPAKVQKQSLLNKLKSKASQRILIVEDNPINQKILKLMLDRLDLETDTYENGALAVDAFAQNNYGLILMDIRMPVMDGLEATKKIIASQKYQDNPCPIVAVSANAFEEDRRAALKAGMKDFIAKPVKRADLEKVLKDYLNWESEPLEI